MKAFVLLRYITIFIGLCALFAAYKSYTNTQQFLQQAVTTQGTVIDLIARPSEESITYAPQITFVTKDGLTINWISSTSSNPPSYSRGEQVEILYLENEPENARINSVTSVWILAIVLSIIGGIFLIVGLSSFFIGRQTSSLSFESRL